MNSLVKLTRDCTGEPVPKEEQFMDEAGSRTVFCDGQKFGYGESSVEYQIKYVQRKGITCQNCIERIKKVKDIRL